METEVRTETTTTEGPVPRKHKRREPYIYQVCIPFGPADARCYLVSFGFQRFDPPRITPGKYRPRAVQALTVCMIGPAFSDDENQMVTGEAACSTRDEYNHVGGAVLALNRAVEQISPSSSTPEQRKNLAKEFRSQVIPKFAARSGRRRRVREHIKIRVGPHGVMGQEF